MVAPLLNVTYLVTTKNSKSSTLISISNVDLFKTNSVIEGTINSSCWNFCFYKYFLINEVYIHVTWFWKCFFFLQILKNKGLIAVVVGGYDLLLRERCAKYMSKFDVLGYLIDGLFSDEIGAHEVPSDSAMKIISHTVVRLNYFELLIDYILYQFYLLHFFRISCQKNVCESCTELGILRLYWKWWNVVSIFSILRFLFWMLKMAEHWYLILMFLICT